MIDLHCHILPAVDDGAPDWDTALAMMAIADDAGTETIVATPHSHDFWRSGAHCGDAIPQLVAEANRRARQAGMSLEILPGQECMIDPDLPGDLKSGRWLALASSRTILLEFPFVSWPPFAERFIDDLHSHEYTILLAHPERYRAVATDPNLLYGLVERGVLAQLTAGSLLGVFGERVQETSRLLLEHNLVHVLASDAHTTGGRNPRLDTAVAEAARWVGHEQARRMVVDIPRALLDDKPVETLAPREIERSAKRFFGLFS